MFSCREVISLIYQTNYWQSKQRSWTLRSFNLQEKCDKVHVLHPEERKKKTPVSAWMDKNLLCFLRMMREGYTWGFEFLRYFKIQSYFPQPNTNRVELPWLHRPFSYNQGLIAAQTIVVGFMSVLTDKRKHTKKERAKNIRLMLM